MDKLELVNQIFNQADQKGAMHLYTEDAQFNGRTVRLHNLDVLNFGSCSYMGLELDRRVKSAAIDAVEKYGTQFSSSRAYVSMGIYEEVESLLSQIFGQEILLAPTTSLGHLSAIPAVVGPNDAVIMDIQVHASVQNALQLIRIRGNYVKTIRHSDMEQLEQIIKTLKDKHDRIWYMTDGVYSMHGDTLPVKAIRHLLDTYEQFHVYADDAHGISWIGEKGEGFVLHHVGLHERMVLVSSLAKGFGSCGGVMVIPDAKTRRLVRNCGAGLVFSGPLQPAIVGASIGSARIHLSPEMEVRQHNLHGKIEYFRQKAKEHGLLLIRDAFTPIFFFGVGKLEVGFNLFQRLMKAGYYLNVGLFPGVPLKNTGMRATAHQYIERRDIDALLATLSEELPRALKEENSSMDEVYEAFSPRRTATNASLGKQDELSEEEQVTGM